MRMRARQPRKRSDARPALSQAFLKAVLADWKANGASALATAREGRPHDYLKLVAVLLPKETAEKVDRLDERTDEDIAEELDAILGRLAEAGIYPRVRPGGERQA